MKPLRHATLLGVWLLALGVEAQQYDIRIYGVEDGLPGSTVTAITQDSSGYLRVYTDRGTCRFDGRLFHPVEDGQAPQASSAAALTLADDSRYDQPATCALVSERTGHYWRGTMKGLQVFASTAATRPLLELAWGNGLGSNEITCLFEDRSGAIWIGTRQGGLNRFMNAGILSYGSDGGPYAKALAFTRTTADGVFLVAGENGIAYDSPDGRGGSWSGYTSGGPFRTIFGTSQGTILYGNDSGLLRLRIPVNGEMMRPGERVYGNDPVLAAVLAPSGMAYVGTAGGVIVVDGPGSWIRMGRDTLAATALTIQGDSLLIGTHQGLYVAPLDNSAANWTPVIRAGREDITCLVGDRAGNVFFGTAEAGVVRYQNGSTHRWGEREGLASDRIRQLLLDAYQNLWVGTDRGFNLMELDELQQEVIDIRYYGVDEGFPGIEAMPNACMLDRDSSLWFGTTRGTIHFDPRKVLDDPVPPNTHLTDLTLFFEHPDWTPWCTARDGDHLPIGLRLPYNKNHLTFTFTGLSLAYPEKVRFQYMLEGRDTDWSPITREDHVTFSGLEPGHYTFLVKARNGSGVWNDEPARFAFTITPPFWATTVFRASGGAALLLGFFGLQRLRDRRSRRARERLERIVATRTQELTEEKHRSEALLLNILPETTAAELKERGSAQARSYAECTVLFSDFQGFTVLSEQFEATGIVTELDRFFRSFDRITDKYGTEKIKTIGDAYMCASGVPEPSRTHALDALLMALEMLAVVDEINASRLRKGHPAWPIRIGLNSGPLIAGVVGEKKFAYDVWGDTVNLASRMESGGAPGRVNVTASVMRHVGPYVVAEARGKVPLKGKGDVECWFIDRLRPEYSADDGGRAANERLLELRNTMRTA